MTERAPDPMGAVMDPVTATLIAAAASLLVWTGTAFARTTSQRTSDRHVRIGAHLGLRPTAYGLVGRRGKVYVRVNEVPPPIGSAAGWEVEIEATIPADLGFEYNLVSQGQQPRCVQPTSKAVTLPSTLADLVKAAGDPKATLALFSDPNLRRHLVQIHTMGGTVDLRTKAASVRQVGELETVTGSQIDRAVGLAVAIARAWNRPWSVYASENDLYLSDRGCRMRGRVEGVQVDIRDMLDRHGDRVTRIAADLTPGLPRGTKLLHLDNVTEPDALGYDSARAPFLFASCPSERDLADLLAQPGVMDTVQAIVVNYPHSAINENRVVLIQPGRATQLGDLVQHVIRAEKAIKAACKAKAERDQIAS